MQIGLLGPNVVDSPAFNRGNKASPSAGGDTPEFSLSMDLTRPAAVNGPDDRVTTNPVRQRADKNGDYSLDEQGEPPRSKDKKSDDDQTVASVEVHPHNEPQPSKPSQTPDGQFGTNEPNPDAHSSTAPNTLNALGTSPAAGNSEATIEKVLGQLVYELAINKPNAGQPEDSKALIPNQAAANNVPAPSAESSKSSTTGAGAEEQALLEMEATIAISKSEDSASGSSDSGSNEQTGHHGNVGVGDSREQVVVSPASGGERFSLDGSSPEPTAAAAPKPAQPTTALDARPIAGPKTVNQLALEVGSGNDIVRIQAQQNAGTLRVAVHSPNADLAPHLNERLPELMKQLDLRGFDSRVVTAPPPMRSVEVGQSHSHSSGGFDQHSNDTPRDHQQNRRRSRSQGWDDLVMQLHYE